MQKNEFKENAMGWRIARSVAIVSGLFTLILSILLIVNCVQVKSIAPLDSKELVELRKQFVEAPGTNEDLAEHIRALDFLARKAFFTSQAHLKLGGALLLGGAIIFLISLKLATIWNPDVPDTEEEVEPASEWQSASLARQLVVLGGISLVVFSLVAAYLTRSDISPTSISVSEGETVDAEDVSEPEVAVLTIPTWDDMLKNWPSFRGSGGYGVAHYTNVPIEWDVKTGKNIRWKVELPKVAMNSPVVWGNRVYLSAADKDVREIYCYDTETGKLLWQRALEKLPGTPAKSPKVTSDTGHAAATMVVHGNRVCAIFANGDLACYDSEGNFIWGHNLGVPDNHYGHSSSLIAYENLLFVQYDQRKGGRLIAFDLETGKESWVVKRTRISWASPACVPTPLGFQLIVNSTKDVDAYDPATGGLIWTQKCLSGEVAPSPTISGDIVFVANEYAKASAIKLGGTKEAVTPEVMWEWDEYLPDISSPVGGKDHFYIATTVGDLVCLDKKTGENKWSEMVDDGFNSSPILVGDRIYALDLKGKMYIFKDGPEYSLINAPNMEEDSYATPAYLNGRIYLRTEKNLYCIESGNNNEV